MGKRNSSRTRVAPVFSQLFELDPTGASWIEPLISLGSRRGLARVPSQLGSLLQGHERTWGDRERRLPAPASLLEWLVQNVAKEAVDRSGDRGVAQEKRTLLASRHVETVHEALTRIRRGERGRRWFILEGESCPDAFLETPNLVLVVEGKRTEYSTTTHTKWMWTRSQLLRHMDCAREASQGKPVLGLLIVEGESPDETKVPEKWTQAVSRDLAPDQVEKSLPHRSPEWREELVSGVLGATTWQRVCGTLSLEWSCLG